MKFIEKLTEFMKKFPYQVRDSSLFVVVDNNKMMSVNKLIDLDSITDYQDRDQRDEGFIFGL